MTSIQYITDKSGRRKSAIVPIKEWRNIQKQLHNDDDEPVFTKEEILGNLKEAVEEVKLFRDGKIQLQTFQEMMQEVRAELEQEGY